MGACRVRSILQSFAPTSAVDVATGLPLQPMLRTF